ncbi:hypothetical protein OTK49_21195 [Vibrio coralliirubri]|uniref:hypothetical protein n=1 Tax=Vibrio coralliirubri TaxID=1516159 RepID=UPI002283A7B1|nr:hypothetical protein [Vibrio coralliirubri]MCY9865037.1 hypothetical protein [Vibrio coralliirubri]
MESVYRIAERTRFESQPSIIHVIAISDGERGGGWYRQIISIETMKDRMLNRWIGFWQKRKYQTIESMARFQRADEDFEISYEVSKKHLETILTKDAINDLFPTRTEIHHKSVWDFYKHINYNHKDKKVANIDSLILQRTRKT